MSTSAPSAQSGCCRATRASPGLRVLWHSAGASAADRGALAGALRRMVADDGVATLSGAGRGGETARAAARDGAPALQPAAGAVAVRRHAALPERRGQVRGRAEAALRASGDASQPDGLGASS